MSRLKARALTVPSSADSFAAATEQERVSEGCPETRGALRRREEVRLRWLKPPLYSLRRRSCIELAAVDVRVAGLCAGQVLPRKIRVR